MRKRATYVVIGLAALAVTACSAPSAAGREGAIGGFTAGGFRFLAPPTWEQVGLTEPAVVAPEIAPASVPVVTEATTRTEAVGQTEARTKVCTGW